jgi:hypothetical protein
MTSLREGMGTKQNQKNITNKIIQRTKDICPVTTGKDLGQCPATS